MAKKRTEAVPPPAKLIIPREQFKEALEERIRLILQIAKEKDEFKFRIQFGKWDGYNSEFLKQSFDNHDSEYKREYDDIHGSFAYHSEFSILQSEASRKYDYLTNLLEKSDLLKSSVEIKTPINTQAQILDYKKDLNVFIVHGHKEGVRSEVARTLEQLELKPIILQERPNQGQTIIEKFEKYSSNVGFAVVLLTADDMGEKSGSGQQNARARQNVIFEMGYFFGSLGRGKVFALYDEGVEFPSDLYGIVYEPFDGAGRWRFALVQELRAAGYEVDANRLLAR